MISVVLPIYQTASYLRELHRRAAATLEPQEFELIMVDDGSRDNAWALIQELAAADPRVKGIKLSRNFGQHPALAAGFEHASGELIVMMDSDLQDRPEDIPHLIEALTPDVDVVYSVRVGAESGLTSRIYHNVFSRLTATRVPRNVGTFRVFTRRFLDAVLEYPERNILFGPLMFHIGFEFATVPVQHDPRHRGTSSYSFRKRLQLAINSLLTYTDIPQRVLVNVGGLIVLFSAVYSVSLVVKYLIARERLPQGLTLLALLVTFTMGSLMVAIGMIGTYVFRVYQEVLHRPRYVVARRLNISNPRN